VEGGIAGAVRRNFTAKKGERIQDSVCFYQPIVPGRIVERVGGGPGMAVVGSWILRHSDDGKLQLSAENGR
jgi:hypothetical protein